MTIVADMKAWLPAAACLLLAACAGMGTTTPSRPAPARGDGPPLARLAGEYDNHGQVWQARQHGADPMPVHVRQHIAAVQGDEESWDWQLRMDAAAGKPVAAEWRYSLRRLEDGRLMLTPARRLPDSGKDDAGNRWATLAPCAMQGREQDGHLHLEADQAACSAILPGLGSQAALLPTFLDFDGNELIIKTFADAARGDKARQVAHRVIPYHGWAAINGAGPQAEADSRDWHMQRDLELGNQGEPVPIRWRDGSPSGYSLKLESLDYVKRDMRLLRLSLVRDSDGDTVAYAWADPDARHIGLNLGWLQTGLERGQGGHADGQRR